MIKLTQKQFDKFIDAEDNDYIEKIKNNILSKYADQVVERENLIYRLKEAYNYLMELNFKNETLVRSYLYLTAFNVNFHNSPEVKCLLEVPGKNPEKQYQDLLHVTKNLINRGD
ncbi:hypothetical protein Ppb6_03981 [Photorhabdus australis subsp. thailandensis]|uniref:Uncharacterized protein n=1 Tax=Photorhabdus australis subsp. thailandensis TaxID=2805096 RepID=A0A1C0TYX9_9GAMM|nr:hypothetical protein [Photorhabdus australis]OCQ50883.1 hypothetical protein Ppb6_03981 [Photorhabdus australis subsp. thailandensis]